MHVEVERPVVDPYVPSGQAEQKLDDSNEYVPVSHFPEQAAVVNPAVAP